MQLLEGLLQRHALVQKVERDALHDAAGSLLWVACAVEIVGEEKRQGADEAQRGQLREEGVCRDHLTQRPRPLTRTQRATKSGACSQA